MGSALVVIDMLNTDDFEDGDRLADSVRDTVPNIRTLLDRAADEDVPVIYVNDNHGDWNSSADELVRHGLDGRHPDLVEPIDAYVRQLQVAVPADAVAHIHRELAGAAQKMMERNMSADVSPSTECLLR